MVLLSVAHHSFSSSLDLPARAVGEAHPITLEQIAASGVPVQLSLSVPPGQVLQPGQAVSARVGPYTFTGIVAGQQPSLAYSQPPLQPQYAYQPPQYAYAQQPYGYVQPQMMQQPQFAPQYAPVQQPYAQPVSTGMPGFQLVDIQPPVAQQQLPSPTKTKTIDIPFFDAKHTETASHASLVEEAKNVDSELKRIEAHVQRMNIKRAEDATKRVQAQRQALLQQARILKAQERRQEKARLSEQRAERRQEQSRLIEQRAEQLVAQRMKSQKLTVLPAESTSLSMYSVGANGMQPVGQGTQISGTQSGQPFTGTVQSIRVAPYSSYPPGGTTTQFRIPSFTPQDELKARIAALNKRLKSVAVDNALFQQQNALEKRIADAEQKILSKTGSPLSYDQVVLRMNLLEKRLARLEKLGGSSAAQIRVLPRSRDATPDEVSVQNQPLKAASIHGTTGDYYFSGTLAPAAPASLDDDQGSESDYAQPSQEEWHTTPRMVGGQHFAAVVALRLMLSCSSARCLNISD